MKKINTKLLALNRALTRKHQYLLITGILISLTGGYLEWTAPKNLGEKGSYIKGDQSSAATDKSPKKEISIKGVIYKGFSGNDLTGSGQIIWPDKRRYKGEVQNGLAEGEGRMTFIDGKSYEGSFRQGKMHGTGEIVWPNGSSYRGEFSNDLIISFS